jgi:hypothetical protein
MSVTGGPIRPGHDRDMTSRPTVKPRSNESEAGLQDLEYGL